MTTETACTRFEAVREVLADKKNILTVKELCELAGVSRSGYYRWIGAEKARELREAKDREDFESIQMGSVAENLVNREFEAHGPRAILLTDITYIPLNGAFCYLSTILDAFTKQVLAYVLSESLEVDFVLETVKLRRSMSRRGNCWDNAPQESFFGHMKDELAGELSEWTSFEAVKSSIDRWMDYYNNDCCQWDLAKLSPNEYYSYITAGEYPVDMLPPYGSN